MRYWGRLLALAATLSSHPAGAQPGPLPVAAADASCTSVAQELGGWGVARCTYAQGSLYSREGVESLAGTTDGVPNNEYRYNSLSIAPWTGDGLRIRHYFDGYGNI